MARYSWPIFKWRFWSKAMVAGVAVSKSWTSLASVSGAAGAETLLGLWTSAICGELLKDFWDGGPRLGFFGMLLLLADEKHGPDCHLPKSLLVVGLLSFLVWALYSLDQFAHGLPSILEDKLCFFSHGHGALALQFLEICHCEDLGQSICGFVAGSYQWWPMLPFWSVGTCSLAF